MSEVSGQIRCAIHEQYSPEEMVKLPGGKHTCISGNKVCNKHGHFRRTNGITKYTKQTRR